jgi:hypothetical protein
VDYHLPKTEKFPACDHCVEFRHERGDPVAWCALSGAVVSFMGFCGHWRQAFPYTALPCGHGEERDLTQGLGEERHYICMRCGMRHYRGRVWTRREWTEWVEEKP